MKKVLLIGNGAREHVIGETLKRFGAAVFTYGKARNPGLLELSEGYEVGDLKDFKHLADYARAVKPDFAFIGPDEQIADGVADLLLEQNIYSVAPFKSLARLESSKSFTRDLVHKYGIPGNPVFKVFHNDEGLSNFIDQLEGNYVVKADVLMGGKGVKVSGEHLPTKADGIAYARECIAAAGKVVIEEKFIGQEFSLMSFCDGLNTVEMPAVQDHKRAYEGDTGPNTGGMGTYSDANHSLPFLKKSDIEEASEITRQVAAALYKECGTYYKGIMYGGFIATAKGVKLIEYNARFGDPEAMNVLPILNTNFIHVCEAVIKGDLPNLKVEFAKKATVCKYIVPEGYPENPKKGQRIEVLTAAELKELGIGANAGKSFEGGNGIEGSGKGQSELKMYYSSVDKTPEGLLLSSSRAVAFVGIADSLAEAEKLAESACGSVKGPVFHRKDVGTAALIQSRVDMMKSLRG